MFNLHQRLLMTEASPTHEAQHKAVDDAVGLLRLSQVEPRFKAVEFHPRLQIVDDVQQEVIFHMRLLRMTWTVVHVRTLIIGLTAFLLGVLSPETWGGGDATIGGMQGIREVDGSGFFLMVCSLGLWIWFMFEIWNLFPVMKGHSVSLMFAWISVMMGMILFHTEAPNFPFELGDGGLLGGIVTFLVMVFVIYIFWKAVQETRDQHVEEVHADPDPRKMEEAMSEHSLAGWTFILLVWGAAITLSSWSGVHYVADRKLTMPALLIIHLILGCVAVYGVMHLRWFPQLLLVAGTTKALSRRARVAIADVGAQKADKPVTKVLKNEGKCTECGANVPINRSDEGEPVIDCLKEGCEGKGLANGKCNLCKARIPTRHTCSECGINAPVMDYLEDSEAW